jgi:prepilin-type N-terminal cleavage/methylation domain-containing protein
MKNGKGFTLIEILVVVGIIALIATIGIPNLLRARLSANETAAKANLRSIGSALETYAIANGQYPPATTSLLGQNPPYLNKDYFTGVQSGYVYTAPTLGPYVYSIVATPENTGSGRQTYTVITGAVLTVVP